MKIIKGVRWYYYLLEKEGCDSLFSHFPRSTLLNKFVVCWDYFDLVHQKTHKMYSCFDSYLQFAIYFLKLDERFRCFYEIIFGESMQKPHFDVDIELNDKVINHEKVVEDLINRIIELIPEINVEKDICIYSSHGKNKISYHVIVNNYCHNNNDEAKAFYYKVMEKMPEEYYEKHWIDHSVYSKTQQFRIYGTKKNGTDRLKKFHDVWYLNGKRIVHINPDIEENSDENVVFLRRLEESIVTARPGNCKILQNFEIHEKFRKKIYEKGEDVEYDLAMEAIVLLAHSMGTIPESKSFPFKFDKIDGNFIILRRLKASSCRVCNRKHYHENPYLILTDDKNIFFHCRRATPDKKLYVGTLKVESEDKKVPKEKEPVSDKDQVSDRDQASNKRSKWIEETLKKIAGEKVEKKKKEKEYEEGLVTKTLKKSYVM